MLLKMKFKIVAVTFPPLKKDDKSSMNLMFPMLVILPGHGQLF